jgi:rhamnogalacturonyl hydrolase YesR
MMDRLPRALVLATCFAISAGLTTGCRPIGDEPSAAETSAGGGIGTPTPGAGVAAALPSPKEIKFLMRRVCDYQLALDAATRPTNNWVRSVFYTGVMATHRTTGDNKYRDAAVTWGETSNWSPAAKNPQHADNQTCVQTYAELYLLDRSAANRIAPARAVFDTQIAAKPTGRKNWSWCDALFMSPPALARLSKATGDPKYLAFLHNQFWDAKEFLYDKENHLFYRDNNYFNTQTPGGKKVFWSRGNGWVMAGIARTLEYLPANDPRRADYIALFREMAKSVATVQGADGLWRSSLLEPNQFPMPETSGSALFLYAYAWGINNGVLDAATYLPIVQKGWAGLTKHVDEQGKVSYVQKSASEPGPVSPTESEAYGPGAVLLAAEQIAKLAAAAPKPVPAAAVASSNAAGSTRFNFAPKTTAPEPGYKQVGPETVFDAKRGYGWVAGEGSLSARDRGGSDTLHRGFIFGKTARTFRIAGLPAGRYRLTVVSGDTEFGDHTTQVTVAGAEKAIPVLSPDAGKFATLTTTIKVTKPTLDIAFKSPQDNWVVNYLTLEPAADAGNKVQAEKAQIDMRTAHNYSEENSWRAVQNWPNLPETLLRQFRGESAKQAGTTAFAATGLSRADYLKLISGEVDFWRQRQSGDGAIIDPYRQAEFQYSTPAFAHAAATLVAYGDRKDLIEPAAKAMDWAVRGLSERRAANAHEDFYAPMLAHALRLLKPHVDGGRSSRWESQIRDLDPYKTYRAGIGGNNWNVVALSGEGLFHVMGLRPSSNRYVEDSLAAQKKHFSSPYGLYLEGPMPYDHFPRLWAADMLARGYKGLYVTQLGQVLRRGAITSLFMQSPWGELPAGGRSAHHQWNEAEQCVTYEIYAADAQSAGDPHLAGIFKRAAHLSLASMQRWVRPSGEMAIVKNRVNPAQNHGFESYSSHSQYNLLPMSMLAMAYEHAEKTEAVPEKPAPADQGGYVLPLGSLHKVFANVAGTYLEIDTSGDHNYDATGLIRVHSKGVSPQIGPSDSILANPHYRRPSGSPETRTTGIGISWRDAEDGEWHRMGELGGRNLTRTSVKVLEESGKKVVFDVTYEGRLFGVSKIVEHYVLTQGRIELRTEIPGYSGPLRYIWPVLADDGAIKSSIIVTKGTVMVSQDKGKTSQTFSPLGASRVTVEPALYPNHNGWARLGVAEFAAGKGARAGKATLVILPRPGAARLSVASRPIR